MKYVFTGPSNEYGHCCGLGIDAKRQTFGEMQLQYGKTTINLHHHHANADDVNVIPSIEFLDTCGNSYPTSLASKFYRKNANYHNPIFSKSI